MLSRKSLVLAVIGSLSTSVTWADESLENTSTLTSPVVVTATRSERDSFELPVSIDVVDAEKIQDGQLQVNISESLIRVPGIIAQNRGQYAQDTQISSRGFGARSQFGVRGIRLYADGIPLTMPDGQGQAGTFDLGSAKSIEVMRGPFSSLYGNSAGGVVQIFTADGSKDPVLGGSFTAGSYGTQRESLKLGGSYDEFNYIADYSHLESDGYRDHSAVRRSLFNAKLGIQFNDSTRATLIATDLDQPISQDPLGLTRAQISQNRRQSDVKAINFNSRVEKSHTQIGTKIEHDFDENNIVSLMAYGGVRDNVQYQATGTNSAGNGVSSAFVKNLAANANNQTAGGVAVINRDFAGIDLRFVHKGTLANGPINLSAGINFDTMTDDRKGYDNFINISGSSSTANSLLCGVGVICGVKGILRRNEENTARNFDQYAQAEWSPTKVINLVAGVRHSDVRIENDDNYLANGNSSGKVNFTKTTPIAGVVFKVTPSVNLYANAGKGFETPTLIEMAYLPGGVGSFNSSLKPATSNNYEIGAKAFLGANTRATFAIFKTDTQHEIVVADSTNGRSSYQNAGGTERNGVEISIDSELGYGLSTYASYAYLDAKYSDSFCSGKITSNKSLCTGTGIGWVESGKIIPGTYRQTAYAEISWKYAPIGFSTAIEARGNSKAYVSDTRTDAAAGYGVINWRGGFTQDIQKWHISEFLRVENLFDKNYIGSVKLNDSNAQFYESGAERNWLLGLNASYQF